MHNFTAQQKANIAAIVQQYGSVEGNFATTMLEGIVSAWTDSGIMADAYSVRDAELVEQYIEEDEQDELGVFDIDELCWQRAGQGLLCVHVMRKLAAEEKNGDIEAAADYLRELLQYA